MIKTPIKKGPKSQFESVVSDKKSKMATAIQNTASSSPSLTEQTHVFSSEATTYNSGLQTGHPQVFTPPPAYTELLTPPTIADFALSSSGHKLYSSNWLNPLRGSDQRTGISNGGPFSEVFRSPGQGTSANRG